MRTDTPTYREAASSHFLFTGNVHGIGRRLLRCVEASNPDIKQHNAHHRQTNTHNKHNNQHKTTTTHNTPNDFESYREHWFNV